MFLACQGLSSIPLKQSLLLVEEMRLTLGGVRPDEGVRYMYG